MSVADQDTIQPRSTRRVPFKVQFGSSFVSAFRNRGPRAFEDGPGVSSFKTALLFGTVKDAAVIVQAFEPFEQNRLDSIGDPEGFPEGSGLGKLLLDAKADPIISSLSLIGWCSIQAKEGTQGNEVGFHNRRFRRVSDIALLLRPADNSTWNGELYTRCSAGLLSGSNCCWTPLHFSPERAGVIWVELNPRLQMDGRLYLRTYEPSNVKSRASQADPLPKSLDPVLSRKEVPVELRAASKIPDEAVTAYLRTRASFWLLAVVIFGVCLAGTLLYLPAHKTRSAVIAARPALPAVTNPVLELRVAGENDRLILSWDRNNPLIRSAIGAELQIADGKNRRDVQLSSDQLSGGTLIYKPASPDVTFKLALRDPAGRAVLASVRSLDGTINSWTPGILAVPIPKAAHNGVVHAATAKATPPGPVPSTQPLRFSRPEVKAIQADSTDQQPILDAIAPPQLKAEPQPVIDGLNLPAALPDAPVLRRRGATPEGEAWPTSSAPTRPSSAISAPASGTAPFPDIYKPPRPLKRPAPRFVTPETGHFEPVSLEVTVSINASGRVTAARISQSTGHLSQTIESAAVAAAREWQFEPAALRGKEIPSEYTIVFRFHP